VNFGIVVARESDKSALAALLSGFEGFQRSARTQDFVRVILILRCVYLPEIDVNPSLVNRGRLW
jgi:hypothetical protein